MNINNAISKNTADNDRIRFHAYLQTLMDDRLIEDFIDLDDSLQSRLKSSEKRGDFFVTIGTCKIAIELKNRVLGSWKDEETVVKVLSSIQSNDDYEQLLKDQFQLKDIGKDPSYRSSVWADPKSATKWKSKRRSQGKNQLSNTASKYGDDTYLLMVYCHHVLPVFIDNGRGMCFRVPTEWSNYFIKKEIKLFKEVHLPVDIVRRFKGHGDQLFISLLLLENPMLKDFLHELPNQFSCLSEEHCVITGVNDDSVSDAVFNFSGTFTINNSCSKPLPPVVLKKLTRDAREVKTREAGSRLFTYFYPEHL